MIVRRETLADVAAVREVVGAAFAVAERAGPVDEVVLLDALRECDAWLPALSHVALAGNEVVGHVVCTRAHVSGRPVLGLGPLSVHPDRQRRGVGTALMHSVLGAADALDEPLVVLLGHADYYPRFGFRPAEEYGVIPPVPGWRAHFQALALTSYHDDLRGQFVYAEPFRRFE
jgi:putative acetyltransferase